MNHPTIIYVLLNTHLKFGVQICIAKLAQKRQWYRENRT